MKIGKVETIQVIDTTRSAFDAACEAANALAIDIFGISIDGHSDIVNFNRSTDSIHTKFLSYEHTGSMGGHEYVYKFEAWIEREE